MSRIVSTGVRLTVEASWATDPTTDRETAKDREYTRLIDACLTRHLEQARAEIESLSGVEVYGSTSRTGLVE